MYDPYMRQPREGRSYRLLFAVGIAGIIILNFWLRSHFPALARWLPGIMLVTGLPTAIALLFAITQYKQVFDYEPTTFWGRPTTGKQVRAALSRIMNIGWGLSIVGIILFLLY